VSKPARVRRVVDDAFGSLGRIEVVVSNAGYSLVGAVEEPTDEQVERQLDTNVLGSMTLARAALPHLRRQGGGHLIQFSSVGGFPFVGIYNATKWAMEGFYEALAQESPDWVSPPRWSSRVASGPTRTHALWTPRPR
jgi:NAD(P)-dependent dehydrogenase (short-subunit alcohol dehydrogenase family)